MSEPDLSHLLPEFRAQALLPDAERVVRIRSERWVDHPAALDVLGQLQEIAEQPPRGRMLNALLTAAPGMGKTMTMPPLPTEEEFFGQVFGSLGTPTITYHSGPRRRDTAIRLLRECGTRTLIIDELNSVLAGSPRQQRVFLQLLRFLSNELGIALICAGAPETRQALLTDPQLRSRFIEIDLPPWQDGEELRVFLARLVQSLPLRQPSPVDSPALRRLVAVRSAGLTWTICKAVERAAVAAIASGCERLDRSSFEDPQTWRGLAVSGRAGARPGARPSIHAGTPPA